MNVYTKFPIDWESEQVKIALAKVDETLNKLKEHTILTKPGGCIYKQHAVESVFAKYTGVFRSYKTIIAHLRHYKN